MFSVVPVQFSDVLPAVLYYDSSLESGQQAYMEDDSGWTATTTAMAIVMIAF